MTLPNMPFGSTSPEDLPENVTHPDNLGPTLQDQSAGWYKTNQGDKFPSQLNGTLAGSPLASGAMGIVNGKVANFTSGIANSDPVNINGPEDLRGRVNSFFDINPLSLLVVVLQPLVSLLGLIPIVGQSLERTLSNFLAGIANEASAASAAASVAQTTATTADTKATAAQSAISTGVNGAIVSQGVLDGLTYQLQVFTSNGTFTPPTPPAGKVISHFIGTVYGGGWSGDRVGSVVGSSGRGGRGGRRVPRRISVEEMGSGQPITVGAGAAPVSATGPGTAGGASSIGSLLRSDSGATGVDTPFGDLRSSGEPGEGGRGGQKIADGTTSNGTATYTYTEGQRGEDAGGLGGDGGCRNSSWLGENREPQPGGQGAVVGDHTTGGGGGGGGCGGPGSLGTGAQSGAAGGAPGGGGGAAGAGAASYGGTLASGPGGRGQVDILTVFKDAPT